MKIVVRNNELVFRKVKPENWIASMSYLDYSLNFIFNESIFKKSERDFDLIDWNLVEKFINHFISNLESIQFIGSTSIQEFQKNVHLNDIDYRKENGNFEIDEIELMDFRKLVDYDQHDNKFILYNFKYNVTFFFERANNGYSESADAFPEYPYIAQFSNHNSLTLMGVFNDIWSSYK